MARYWELLGFVTRIDIPEQPPIYIEVQRLLPSEKGGGDDDDVSTESAKAEDVQTALGGGSKWQLNGKDRLIPKLRAK